VCGSVLLLSEGDAFVLQCVTVFRCGGGFVVFTHVCFSVLQRVAVCCCIVLLLFECEACLSQYVVVRCCSVRATHVFCSLLRVLLLCQGNACVLQCVAAV